MAGQQRWLVLPAAEALREVKLRRLFFIFNSFQFFFSLLLWVPIFYEYQKRIGLSDTEIFRIQSLYYLVFCLLEIPTGYVADWLGYRLCLILGSAVLVAANIWVPLAPTYDGFLIHFILIALARSFVSGASSAYLYDWLHRQNQLDEYKEAEGRARAYSLIGRVGCWSIVGVIMQWHLTLPYWLTAVNAGIGLLFAYLLPETKSHRERRRISIVELFSVLVRSPYLLLLMFQGVALFVLARIGQVNLFQPLLENKGFSVVSYGMMMALMTVFEAIGSFRPKWIRRFMSDLHAIFVLTFVLGLSFFLMSFESLWGVDQKIVTVFSLCLFSYVIGVSFPIQRQLINEAIAEPHLRASLLSSESIIDRGVNSLVASSLGAALAGGHLLLYLRKSAIASFISVFVILFLINFVRKNKHERT